MFEAPFTLLHIRIYPFSCRSVLPVHTAPGTFENAVKTMKRSHYSTPDKKENAIKTRLPSLPLKLRIMTANRFFKQLTATKIPPSTVLTSSESAMLREVIQIGGLRASS